MKPNNLIYSAMFVGSILLGGETTKGDTLDISHANKTKEILLRREKEQYPRDTCFFVVVCPLIFDRRDNFLCKIKKGVWKEKKQGFKPPKVISAKKKSFVRRRYY